MKSFFSLALLVLSLSSQLVLANESCFEKGKKEALNMAKLVERTAGFSNLREFKFVELPVKSGHVFVLTFKVTVDWSVRFPGEGVEEVEEIVYVSLNDKCHVLETYATIMREIPPLTNNFPVQ